MRASKIFRERAREMRDQPTAAELKLWNQLRNEQLNVKFRRQHPLGSYIVDFYCRECWLVVEVDGETHEPLEAIEYDGRRDAYLKGRGLTVLRFKNEEVLGDLVQVVVKIRAVVETRRKEHPPLPPR